MTSNIMTGMSHDIEYLISDDTIRCHICGIRFFTPSMAAKNYTVYPGFNARLSVRNDIGQS